MVSVTSFRVSVVGYLVDSAAAGGSNILEQLERFLDLCVFRTGFRRWLFNGFRYVIVLWFRLSFVLWFPSWQEMLFYGFRRWLFNGGFRRGKQNTVF